MEQGHNNRFRWILLVIFVALAGYKLFPTIQLSQMDTETVQELEENDPQRLVDLRSRSIKQGLDLQGGMHLVLEVDLVGLVDNLARNKDSQFTTRLEQLDSELNALSDFWSLFEERFSDVQLSKYFNRNERGRRENAEVVTELQQQAVDAIDNSLTILRNRVDGTGLQEPSITKQGQRRIVVELAGVNDPETARRLIGKTALLEFKLVEDTARFNTVLIDINSLLAGDPIPSDTLAEDSLADAEQLADESAGITEENADTIAQLQSGEEAADSEEIFDPLADNEMTGDIDAPADRENPLFSLLIQFQNGVWIEEANRPALMKILEREDVQRLIPPTSHFILGRMETVGEDQQMAELFLVRKEADLTGKVLETANVNIDQGYSSGRAGSAIVELSMNSEGARKFARITGDYTDRRLAIVLDDKVYMAPVIRSKIPNGRAIIEGMESTEEARELANLLKHGALPSTVKVVEERTVGASLGAESVAKGKTSVMIGFVLVILFMMVYYKKSGIFSVVALLLNMLFIMGILAAFNATLTLPGIAGIILTIGMAVDANVLIFERIREELRLGRSIRAAVDAGYDRAFRTIVDANVTTLIAGVVLYQFGTGPIRGFALTLMIGIACSMYTAIVVTKLLYEAFTNYDASKLSI